MRKTQQLLLIFAILRFAFILELDTNIVQRNKRDEMEKKLKYSNPYPIDFMLHYECARTLEKSTNIGACKGRKVFT